MRTSADTQTIFWNTGSPLGSLSWQACLEWELLILIHLLSRPFRKPFLQVGRVGWRSARLHALHFPENHLRMLYKLWIPFFHLLLICAGLSYFSCVIPIADHPIKSWHISLLLNDSLTTAGNSHPFSARARRDCKISLKHEGEIQGKRKTKKNHVGWRVAGTGAIHHSFCGTVGNSVYHGPVHFCLLVAFNSLTSVAVYQSFSLFPCPK